MNNKTPAATARAAMIKLKDGMGISINCVMPVNTSQIASNTVPRFLVIFIFIINFLSVEKGYISYHKDTLLP